MMYKEMYKAGQKQVYKDAKARLVQPVQDTQEVFDNSLVIYAQNNSFANRYGNLVTKHPILGTGMLIEGCIALYIFLNVLRIVWNL